MTYKMSFQPAVLSEKEILLAKVLKLRQPVRGRTEPLVAVEWYETLRDVAQVFFPVGSDAWYEFMNEAGYFTGN